MAEQSQPLDIKPTLRRLWEKISNNPRRVQDGGVPIGKGIRGWAAESDGQKILRQRWERADGTPWLDDIRNVDTGKQVPSSTNSHPEKQ